MRNEIVILKKKTAGNKGWISHPETIHIEIMVYREENYCKKCPVAINEQGNYAGICNKSSEECGECSSGAIIAPNKLACPKGFWGSKWFRPDDFEDFLNRR